MTDHDDVRALLTQYSDSAYRKDVDGFISMYAADVRVFDLWGSWEVSGASNWREGNAGWFGSLGAARVVVEFSEVDVSVGGDLATVAAMIQYSGESPEGSIEREMANRLTWVLARVDGAWRVTHEHTSAPVDMESSKVILSR
jgi:uncharacterized protein (TIGR02246 family)